VARIDQLSNPGDHLVHDHFGDEIAVVRSESGKLNAFSNICLHRACPILKGEGNIAGKYLICPYHKWAYELDGQLRGAPLMEQADGFIASSDQLQSVALEIWQGWVFLNIDPKAEPLAPRLIELEEKLSAFGFAELRHVETLSFSSPWNWKILIENFLESYHHMGTHPETLNPVFPAALFALIRSPDTPYAIWYQLDITSKDHFDLKVHILVHDSMASNSEAIAEIVASTTAIHLEACLWQFYRYLEKNIGIET
jgi:phenylpropionate dioxygenase-like ring-hydroxylating dioxygenase large terminal subunit